MAPVAPEPKLKKLLRNMVYVGVMAHLLSLEMAEVEEAISKQFSGKKRATEVNVAAARAGTSTPLPIWRAPASRLSG